MKWVRRQDQGRAGRVLCVGNKEYVENGGDGPCVKWTWILRNDKVRFVRQELLEGRRAFCPRVAIPGKGR